MQKNRYRSGERVGEIHKYAPVFLFGVGSAAYLKDIIEKSSKEVNVVVYEPSIHIFYGNVRKY